MLVLSTVEAQFSLHERNNPQKHGNAKKPAANYEPGAKVRNCCDTLALYSVSHKLHDNLRRLAARVRNHQSTSRCAYYIYGDSYT